MAGPSTTGELGLDISDFEREYQSAITNIAELEPAVRSATARLKQMERAFRGAGEAGDVTSKKIERQTRVVKNLESELKASKAEANAFSDALGMDGAGGNSGKAATSRMGALAKLFTASAIASFARTLATTGREASELTKNLAELDRSNYADTFTEGDRAAKGFRNAVLDVVGALSNIPIVGGFVEAITAPFTAAAKRATLLKGVQRDLQTSVVSANDLIGKLRKLEEDRAKVRDEQGSFLNSFYAKYAKFLGAVGMNGAAGVVKDFAFGESDDALLSIETKRADVVKKIAEAMDDESKSRNVSIAGSELQAKLAAIELDRRSKVAALEESLKDAAGNTSAEGIQAFMAGGKVLKKEANARKKVAEDEYEIQMQTTELAESQARARLRGINGQVTATQQLMGLAKLAYENTKGHGEEEEAAAKARYAQAQDAYTAATEAADDELTTMRLQTSEVQARYNGMQSIARQTEIIAKFEQQITDARRSGNKEAESLLQTQRDIALNEERAREHDVTSAQRAVERRQARITQRKALQQEGRESELRRRGQGGGGLMSGGLSSGGLTSGGLSMGSSGIAITAQKAKDALAGNRDKIAAQLAGDVRKIVSEITKGE